MPNISRSLVILAGGNVRPGVTLERYLSDIGKKAGIGLESMWKAWRDQYMSAETEKKLRNLAQEKAKKDDNDRIEWWKRRIDEIEKSDPFFPVDDIANARIAVANLQHLAELSSRVDVHLRNIEALQSKAAKEADECSGAIATIGRFRKRSSA